MLTIRYAFSILASKMVAALSMDTLLVNRMFILHYCLMGSIEFISSTDGGAEGASDGF